MANCSITSIGFNPLTNSGISPYPEVLLGLYPNGSNDIPQSYLDECLVLASEIVPRKPNGQPNPNGKIGFGSLGFSNPRNKFQTWVNTNPSSNTKLKFFNGAQPGKTAENWSNSNDLCWNRFLLAADKVFLEVLQIQVIWIELINLDPIEEWPIDKDLLVDRIELTLTHLKTTFPNVKLVYFSSRTYAGYADSPGNPEPYAYQNGFAVREVIEKKINGLLLNVPHVLWGPYLWADGIVPREGDNLTWNCEDFENDGLHPSPLGCVKVSNLLTEFFTTHPTSTSWFNVSQRNS